VPGRWVCGWVCRWVCGGIVQVGLQGRRCSASLSGFFAAAALVRPRGIWGPVTTNCCGLAIGQPSILAVTACPVLLLLPHYGAARSLSPLQPNSSSLPPRPQRRPQKIIPLLAKSSLEGPRGIWCCRGEGVSDGVAQGRQTHPYQAWAGRPASPARACKAGHKGPGGAGAGRREAGKSGCMRVQVACV